MLRTLMAPTWLTDLMLMSALTWGLLVPWVLAALAARRAADADVSEWIAAVAIVLDRPENNMRILTHAQRQAEQALR